MSEAYILGYHINDERYTVRRASDGVDLAVSIVNRDDANRIADELNRLAKEASA